ncbi:hypothetical protein [Gimibacter soli]|uniref:Uncharacterized protein n=1 Tax=Gimibacter soli TaxID=3024400 RepID=A0AAE9XUS4_9PROT|nr:hypothetical protein [Gimibacter soli]WCL54995.1 hypothetical protein PH603_04385 [Gimibacter soli]
MDNNTLAIYIHELRNQIMHTEASFNLFNQAMTNRAGPGVLFAGQMILMPGSQIASLLWPARARARGRGEALRKVLGLDEKHPLNDRRLSEIWEHSDEKIEEWIAATKGKRVVIDFVGNPFQDGSGVTEDVIYRAYNPDTKTYYFRGVGYNLEAVAKAIGDVANRVNAIFRQMFPERAKAEDEARARMMEAMQAQVAAAQAEAGEAAAPAADAKEEKADA